MLQHLCKSIFRLFVLTCIVWITSINTGFALPFITNVRGEVVPPEAPLIVGTHYEVDQVMQQVPNYIGEGKGPGFLSIMGKSSKASMKQIAEKMSVNEIFYRARSKVIWESLEQNGLKLSAKRIIIKGHFGANSTIAAPIKEFVLREKGNAINISPTKLGKNLGGILKDDVTIDMTTCGACRLGEDNILNKFSEGLVDSGIRNARIRSQVGSFNLRNGIAESEGDNLGTIEQYIEGRALNKNFYEGGVVIEDGQIREATKNELKSWSEIGFSGQSTPCR